MKRFLVISFFLCLHGSKVYGQATKVDLLYKFSFEQTSDTFIIGQPSLIDIVIYNNDDSTVYNLREAFCIGAVDPKNPEIIKPGYINKLTDTLNIQPIPGHGAAKLIHVPFKFDHYYKADTDNIVIVWPVGGYTNTDINELKDTVGYQHVYLKKDTTAKKNGISTISNNNLLKDARFTMYPNPASDYIYTSTNNLNNATIKIADLQGQTVAQYTMPAGPGKHDLTISTQGKDINLKDGTYFIMLQSDEYTEVKKLLIAK